MRHCWTWTAWSPFLPCVVQTAGQPPPACMCGQWGLEWGSVDGCLYREYKLTYLGQPQLSLECSFHSHHLLTHHLPKERKGVRRGGDAETGTGTGTGIGTGIGIGKSIGTVLALELTSSKLSKKSLLLTSPLLMSRIRCFNVSTRPVRASFSPLAPSSFVCSPVISRSEDDSDTSSSAMRLASRSSPVVWGIREELG